MLRSSRIFHQRRWWPTKNYFIKLRRLVSSTLIISKMYTRRTSSIVTKVWQKNVELLPCDPLCKLYQKQDRRNIKHGLHNAKDLETFFGIAENILKRACRGRMFCFTVHFVSCWRCCCARTENQENSLVEMEVFQMKHSPCLTVLITKTIYETPDQCVWNARKK